MTTQLNYAEQLLDEANKGRRYLSVVTGDWVSASIVDRYEADTPLNDMEAEAFEFVTANYEFVEAVIAFVEEARVAGHRRYAIKPVIDRARWERDMAVNRTDDRFEINDHVAPYLSRIVNECIGSGFFTTRSVEGEPGWNDRKIRREVVQREPGRRQNEVATSVREAIHG